MKTMNSVLDLESKVEAQGKSNEQHYLSLSFLLFMTYFLPPLLGVILYLPIRSIHGISHGCVSACLADSLL